MSIFLKNLRKNRSKPKKGQQIGGDIANNKIISMEGKVNGIPTRQIFISEGANGNELRELEAMFEYQLTGLNNETKKTIFKDLKTGKNDFKVLLFLENPNKEWELGGYAMGKYTNGFDRVTTEGWLRSSEVKWIEILEKYRGKKLCQPLMEFIIQNLYTQGVDNIKIDNVGGLSACICYLKAAEKFNAKGFFASNDDTIPWYPIDIDQCENLQDSLNYLFFERDSTLPYRFPEEYGNLFKKA